MQYISPRRLYFATTSNLNPPCQAPKYPSLPRHSSSSRTHVAQKSLTASCFSKCAAARQTTTSVSLPGSTPLAMLQSTTVSLLQSTAVSLLQSTVFPQAATEHGLSTGTSGTERRTAATGLCVGPQRKSVGSSPHRCDTMHVGQHTRPQISAPSCSSADTVDSPRDNSFSHVLLWIWHTVC